MQFLDRQLIVDEALREVLEELRVGRPLPRRSEIARRIDQTGAEEVAWDLSDLYASGDDPRIESDFAEAEAAAAAFRDRTYGKSRPLSLRAFRERLDAQPAMFDADDWGACGCL